MRDRETDFRTAIRVLADLTSQFQITRWEGGQFTFIDARQVASLDVDPETAFELIAIARHYHQEETDGAHRDQA